MWHRPHLQLCSSTAAVEAEILGREEIGGVQTNTLGHLEAQTPIKQPPLLQQHFLGL